MSKVLVMGHVPADTDSVCSPIVYAWYLKNIKGMDAEAVMNGNLSKEAAFVLEHFQVEAPRQINELTTEDQLVLVDSTNPKELLTGFDAASIIEVVDHHKLGGLSTDKPLTVTIRPYGCVATVIYEIMGENVAKLPKEIAGLMLAGITSDTLNLTSPTTTELDRETAIKLAEIAGENKDELANGMFAAKSDISDLTAMEVILTDQKNFDFGGKTYKVSAIETTNPESVLNRIDEFKSAAEAIKTEASLEGVYVFIVDIIKSEATLFATSGAEAFAEKAFSKQFENGLMHLSGVVSRKKQMVPAFEAAV